MQARMQSAARTPRRVRRRDLGESEDEAEEDRLVQKVEQQRVAAEHRRRPEPLSDGLRPRRRSSRPMSVASRPAAIPRARPEEGKDRHEVVRQGRRWRKPIQARYGVSKNGIETKAGNAMNDRRRHRRHEEGQPQEHKAEKARHHDLVQNAEEDEAVRRGEEGDDRDGQRARRDLREADEERSPADPAAMGEDEAEADEEEEARGDVRAKIRQPPGPVSPCST